MTIEITAKLVRGPVYFTSETVKCTITFKNVSAVSSSEVAPNSNNGVEMLAWAGVQIYCHCSLDESKVTFVPETRSHAWTLKGRRGSGSSVSSINDTSFNPSMSEKGNVIFSTAPEILVCGLVLQPNESTTLYYEQKIPLSSPPSYYGSSVKYLYKLTIGAQRVNEVVQLLKIPLRILSILPPGKPLRLQVDGKKEDIKGDNGDQEDPESYGFDDPTLNEEDKMELIIHRLECVTSKKCNNTFIITNPSGQVGRFSLLKNSYKLGEDIIGLFNFSDAQVPCVQFSVTLQSEELITNDCSIKSGSGANSLSQRVNHSRYHEYCLHHTETHMILPVPLTVTPAFATNVMSLSWRLHFEFVTTKQQQLIPIEMPDSQGVMMSSPHRIQVQTMVWDLPLNIYPNHPIQVSRGLQLPASTTLYV